MKSMEIIREKLTFQEAKQLLIAGRGVIAEMLDLALQFGDLSQKERDIMYFRLIEWHSLEKTGKQFGVTRERIRQIEAKAEEKLKILTQERAITQQ